MADVSSTLIGYEGLLWREELALVRTPPGSATHRPVPHHELVVIETLGFRKIGAVAEQYAVSNDGMKLFGPIELEEGFPCRFLPRHRIAAALPCHVGVARHAPRLVFGKRVGRSIADCLKRTTLPCPTSYRLLVRCPVDALIGDCPHPFFICALRSSSPLGSLPSNPHRKFRRTYLTPDSTFPLVCARYAAHSRGLNLQYRAKSKNTGFQTTSPRSSTFTQTVFIRS
jgi:hypothetical protein